MTFDNLVFLLKNYGLAGSVVIILVVSGIAAFWGIMKSILARFLKQVDDLVVENKQQRESFTTVLTNHIEHQTLATTKLVDSIEGMCRTNDSYHERTLSTIDRLSDRLMSSRVRKKKAK